MIKMNARIICFRNAKWHEKLWDFLRRKEIEDTVYLHDIKGIGVNREEGKVKTENYQTPKGTEFIRIRYTYSEDA